MASPVYATEANLISWMGVGSAPAGADRALRDASLDIDGLLFGTVYDVDDNEQPTDTDVADALRDATCAQAEYALAVGDHTGADAQKSQVKVDKVSYSLPTDPATGRVIRDKYAPRAVDILRVAGLVPSSVVVV